MRWLCFASWAYRLHLPTDREAHAGCSRRVVEASGDEGFVSVGASCLCAAFAAAEGVCHIADFIAFNSDFLGYVSPPGYY